MSDKLLNEEEIAAAAMKLANGRPIIKAAGWAGSGWTKVYAVMVKCDIGYAAYSVDTFGNEENMNGGNKRDLWQRVSNKAQSDVTYGR